LLDKQQFPEMKYLSLPTLVLLTCITVLWSCKKSEDNNPKTQVTSNMLMTKMSVTGTDNLTQSVLFTHDSQKRLTGITSDLYSNEFSYNNDGTCYRVTQGDSYTEFHYKDGKPDYTLQSDYYGNEVYFDTTFYEYGSNGLMAKKTGSNMTQLYMYDNNNQVKWIIESGEYLLHTDTTFIEWNAKGNLLKEIKHVSGYNYVTTYRYDNKHNYYKTINYPKEVNIVSDEFGTYVTSTNNCILQMVQFYNNTSSIAYEILEYNNWGYPVKMKEGANIIEYQYME